jgi:quercetin dioxygenase-like cupin family protein
LDDPQTGQPIPCRVIFVYSSADAAICRQTREQDIERPRAGLERIGVSVARGHPRTTQASVARRVAELFGRRAAARFFHWELVPLTSAEQAALPQPSRGCRRPAYRFTFAFDAQAAAAAVTYDGLSVLVTTAPRTQSADALFTQFKRQNYVELRAYKRSPALTNSTRYKGMLHSQMAGTADNGGAFDFVIAKLPRGTEPPPHVHSREGEFIYVLSGEMSVYVEGEVFRVVAGECMFLPRRRPHAWLITSEEAYVILLIVPGGFNEAFSKMGAPAERMEAPTDVDTVTYATADLTETIKVFEQYGGRFLTAD